MSEAETFRVALALEVERDELRALLAASQAREKALLEALRELADACQGLRPSGTPEGNIDRENLDRVRMRVARVFAFPADTSALDAERAKERAKVLSELGRS